ncbi:MAG: extracellular solute-binding protein [Lachnospiraceae bacterium]|jgi:putative aldouronate transport system substrate-binding protein|nr:extracellular solute-binding protein [Lachnospiraceae bacterium]
MKKRNLRGIFLGAAVMISGLAWFRMEAETEKEQAEKELYLGVTIKENLVFPAGQTMTNNQLLDLIRDELGIHIVYDWIYTTEEFNRNIDMHIACDALPDALLVEEEQYLQMLEYGQLQPVTELYEKEVSEQVKAFAESGGDKMMEAVKKGGEMMAIPFPNLIASNINVMWIRQDWLEQLGLEAPRTMEEIIAVSEQFVEKQMGGRETIGILGPGIEDSLTAVGKCCFGLGPIFSAFHAYPGYWITNKDGELVYGSVQDEARQALEVLAELYQKGILDPEIFFRENIQEILDTGKVGIFFGPWWAAERLERDMIEHKSEWQAYGAPLDAQGKYICTMPSNVNQYLVIHKKCRDPESVIKVLNYGLQLEYGWRKQERQEGPSIMAYPLGWEHDFANELEYTWTVLNSVLQGSEEEISYSGHKMLQSDMDDLKDLNRYPYDHFGMEDYREDKKESFIRLFGILNGVRPIADQNYHPVYNEGVGLNSSGETKWKALKTLEEQTYAKIILGQESIEAFDEFVRIWEENGTPADN